MSIITDFTAEMQQNVRVEASTRTGEFSQGQEDRRAARRLDQHYKRRHPKVTRIYYIRHTYVSCAPYFTPFTGVMGAKY